MIRAASWFRAEDCGVYYPAGESWALKSPAFSGSEAPSLIGRPVKYFSRMTSETRCCLCAAALAVQHASFEGAGREIGVLSAGSVGAMAANEEYFRDYVANGRTLGRGNLFIYTLQTSAMGEVAIALGLTGPCLFVQALKQPVVSMIRIATAMLGDGEADRMLALWSDPASAVCFFLEPGEGGEKLGRLESMELPAPDLCRALREQVRRP